MTWSIDDLTDFVKKYWYVFAILFAVIAAVWLGYMQNPLARLTGGEF